ncbi:MAG: helix-turn-helix domain-containing protein [Acidimicrobiales bacterium]|nr:helix-turn-helix domain-containing protein [Acidimicrobiales bacterium]
MRLLTTREAADELRCSTGFVYKLIRTGRLTTTTIGRKRYVPADAIEQIIEAGTKAAER